MTTLQYRTSVLLTFVFFFLAWSIAAHLTAPEEEGGLVLLPAPTVVAHDLYDLIVNEGFLNDIFQSVNRITLGLTVSLVPAFILGITLGMMPRAYRMAEPLFSFAKYVPPVAFIPILILWLGIGLKQQVALLCIGTFFHFTVNVAETVAKTPQAYIDAARTLGTGAGRQMIFRVIIPFGMPSFFQHLRTIVAIAWTYLVVTEMVATEDGIGRVIINSQRFLDTGRVLAGVFTIGVLGILSNWILTVVDRLLCRWSHT